MTENTGEAARLLQQSEQDTLLLRVTAIQSASAFRGYLQRYELEPLTVAVASRVRYLTIWNILQGKPVTGEHAENVRRGLLRLTGVPYTAPLLVFPAKNLKAF